MKPEARLLLLCSRWELAAGERDAVLRLLDSNLDWHEVVRLASRHSLVPLLYRHLNALGTQRVPKDAFASLWARYEAIARRNRAMAAELARILRLFDAEGIAAIPYKGPTLALLLYGNVALREYGDLDVLMRSRDVLRAKALLESQGYASLCPLKPHLESELVRSTRQNQLPMVNRARAVMVELHWRTDPQVEVAGLDDDQWWTSLQAIALEGGRVRALRIPELFLILCLHGTKHFWGSLAWLVDVAELIRQHPKLDWGWVIAKARALACERKLALGLLLAHELLGAALPREAEGLVDIPEVRSLGARIAGTMFDPEAREMGVGEAFRLSLRMQDGNVRALRYFFSIAAMPNLADWQWRSLPRSLFFLYFPLRFTRLCGKYLIKPLTRFKGSGEPHLPPGLEHHHRDRIRQVEAAVSRPHRQP